MEVSEGTISGYGGYRIAYDNLSQAGIQGVAKTGTGVLVPRLGENSHCPDGGWRQGRVRL